MHFPVVPPGFITNLSPSRLIVITAAFISLFGNFSFFAHALQYYPLSGSNILFLLSLAVFLTSLTVILLGLACARGSTKPVLIIVLLASSLAAYFMDSYSNVFDDTMIQNMVSTDPSEVSDLFSGKLLVYLLLLGILPAILVYKANINYGTLKTELFGRAKLFGVMLLIIVSMVLVFSKYYASFFREHRSVTYYANPAYYIYSTGKYINSFTDHTEKSLAVLGTDAQVSADDNERELIIMVIGETARADRFSLNGYNRDTNPLLEKEDIINFSNVSACGTSTAVSVPCMFSIFTRSEYSPAKVNTTENLLDVLKRAGVNVLWRDNNSDSKGVALRVPYEDYRSPDLNPVCDIECRDEGMLTNLQTYINRQKKGDIFIVLHQFGNHGPAYYKRYPKSFEKFTPVCATNELKDCSTEQINNAYDNAILYTDYFLSKVIALLKSNSEKFQTAMFYVSDHGESLGENGLYLHGFPYLIAPNTQLHVPAVMWLGDSMTEDFDKAKLKLKAAEHFSHDNVFHTVLGFMEINTSIYDRKLDILAGTEKNKNGKPTVLVQGKVTQ